MTTPDPNIKLRILPTPECGTTYFDQSFALIVKLSHGIHAKKREKLKFFFNVKKILNNYQKCQWCAFFRIAKVETDRREKKDTKSDQPTTSTTDPLVLAPLNRKKKPCLVA